MFDKLLSLFISRTFFSSYIVIWPLVISCLVSNIAWRSRISGLQETLRWTKIMWKQLVDCFLINGWAQSQWLTGYTTRRLICMFHLSALARYQFKPYSDQCKTQFSIQFNSFQLTSFYMSFTLAWYGLTRTKILRH